MLEIRGISKKYKTGDLVQQALDGVSLHLRKSEFVSILGPSGSGKTTLLNIIGGLDRYDEGDLLIAGRSTKEYRDRDWDAYRNHSIGFVFQSYNLIPHQTILANVELTLTLSGVSKKERRSRAQRALEEVGLGDQLHKKPGQLSGGQMQRVAIARALVNDPDIVLADEPTGALDSETSVQIMELLKEVAKTRLVVMVTHNSELARQYSSRIVNLKDGKIISDTDPYEPDSPEIPEQGGTIRKSSMRFSTAFSLSLNNLWTKKARTLLVSFAGSIGIIGIALILSLASGADNYIAYIEEDTLSEYPLEITASGYDFSSMMSTAYEEAETLQNESREDAQGEEDDEIGVGRMLTGVLSTADTNDLASLKAYLESEESGIDEYVSYIEYGYEVTPYIYQMTQEGVRQVNPNTTFSALETGSITDTSSAVSSIMSTIVNADVFYQLPFESSVYEDKYVVRAGRWPESYDECIVVLNAGGTISDYMLYILGLRDSYELDEMIQQYLGGEEVETPDELMSYDPNELLGIEFCIIHASDLYEYDAEYGVYVDRSANASYLSLLAQNADVLKVVGVVQLKDESTTSILTSGIYYTEELVRYITDYAAESEIVQRQMEDPSINVFTGEPFGVTTTSLDLMSLVSVDTKALEEMFSVDASQLEEALAQSADVSSLFSEGNISVDVSSFSDLGSALGGVSMDVDLGDVFPDLSQVISQGSEEALREPLEVLLTMLIADYQNYVILMGYEDSSDLNAYLMEYLASQRAQIIWQAWSDEYIESGILQESLQSSLEDTLQAALSVSLSSAMESYKQMIEGALQRQMQSAVNTLVDDLILQLEQAVSSYAQEVLDSLTDTLSLSMEIDEEQFLDAFQINMDSDELTEFLMSMSESADATYEENLTLLGYADLDDPKTVTIYPKDFAGKDAVKEILSDYNEKMSAQGQEEKVISYTDLVGTLTGSVTEIIDIISYLLIAFVGISLVVSSIMIGVITYISVLERKKEIGVLRAIGSSKRNISQVFNAETFIIGLCAGLIGVGISRIALIPINILIHHLAGNTIMNAVLLPYQGALLVLLSVLLTMIGGLIPSRKAAKSDPVIALRTE